MGWIEFQRDGSWTCSGGKGKKREETGMSGLAYFTARELMPGFGDRI
jgi:hypothetical protein